MRWLSHRLHGTHKIKENIISMSLDVHLSFLTTKYRLWISLHRSIYLQFNVNFVLHLCCCCLLQYRSSDSFDIILFNGHTFCGSHSHWFSDNFINCFWLVNSDCFNNFILCLSISFTAILFSSFWNLCWAFPYFCIDCAFTANKKNRCFDQLRRRSKGIAVKKIRD